MSVSKSIFSNIKHFFLTERGGITKSGRYYDYGSIKDRLVILFPAIAAFFCILWKELTGRNDSE